MERQDSDKKAIRYGGCAVGYSPLLSQKAGGADIGKGRYYEKNAVYI